MARGVNKVILNLYQSGHSIPDINKYVPCSMSTIRAKLIKMNVIRTRSDSLQLAARQGKLGKQILGKKRTFTDEWKSNISRARLGKGKGFSKKPNGYIEITMGKNKGKMQHRVIMEERLGRELKANEVVHHKNHIRDDNRIDNLEIMTFNEHARHHALERNKQRIRNNLGQYI